MHVQGKELLEAHGGFRCFRLASGAVAVNGALEEADGVEGWVNALLFAEWIPFEWRRATPQIGRRSQRPWLGRGEDANGHLKSRDDAIPIMIHGLQGAAKLVYNEGRDSTSSAYYEVSDDEVNEELSTSRCRHPNQVGVADDVQDDESPTATPQVLLNSSREFESTGRRFDVSSLAGLSTGKWVSKFKRESSPTLQASKPKTSK